MDALWCGSCAKDLVVIETSESVLSSQASLSYSDHSFLFPMIHSPTLNKSGKMPPTWRLNAELDGKVHRQQQRGTETWRRFRVAGKGNKGSEVRGVQWPC